MKLEEALAIAVEVAKLCRTKTTRDAAVIVSSDKGIKVAAERSAGHFIYVYVDEKYAVSTDIYGQIYNVWDIAGDGVKVVECPYQE